MVACSSPAAITDPRQHDHVVGQTHDLVGRVADNRAPDVELVVQAFEVGQDLLLATVVERGERLVHEQDARTGEQRARHADALALATGQSVRHAFEQGLDAEQGHPMVELHAAPRFGMRQAELQVAPHRQVGNRLASWKT